MKKLEPPDSHHVRAVEGWLELGNCGEAVSELAKVAPQFFTHPAVLKVRWDLCAAKKKWDEALEIADAFTRMVPDDPEGYINHANTLYFLGRTAEARDMVVPLLERFPSHPGFLYNLACYECQLGHMSEAQQWLDKAFRLGEGLRTFALQDPDLEPLRRSLRA